MSIQNPDTKEKTTSKTDEKVVEPDFYKVLLHNDDYTTMDFVVEILMNVFNKSFEDATMTMLNVHTKGVGLCGVYTYEIAETKVTIVNEKAKNKGFPLKCTMEKA